MPHCVTIPPEENPRAPALPPIPQTILPGEHMRHHMRHPTEPNVGDTTEPAPAPEQGGGERAAPPAAETGSDLLLGGLFLIAIIMIIVGTILYWKRKHTMKREHVSDNSYIYIMPVDISMHAVLD